MTTAQKVALVETAWETYGLNRALAAVDLPKSTWYYHRTQKVNYEAKYAYLRPALEEIARNHPEYGILRTTDGGSTWEIVNWAPEEEAPGAALRVGTRVRWKSLGIAGEVNDEAVAEERVDSVLLPLETALRDLPAAKPVPDPDSAGTGSQYR